CSPPRSRPRPRRRPPKANPSAPQADAASAGLSLISMQSAVPFGTANRGDIHMAITAQQVKELRDATGVGMMDCKKALAETNGDMEAAIDWLRSRGLAKAAKKAGRV